MEEQGFIGNKTFFRIFIKNKQKLKGQKDKEVEKPKELFIIRQEKII